MHENTILSEAPPPPLTDGARARRVKQDGEAELGVAVRGGERQGPLHGERHAPVASRLQRVHLQRRDRHGVRDVARVERHLAAVREDDLAVHEVGDDLRHAPAGVLDGEGWGRRVAAHRALKLRPQLGAQLKDDGEGGRVERVVVLAHLQVGQLGWIRHCHATRLGSELRTELYLQGRKR